jgi:hypothetical protein
LAISYILYQRDNRSNVTYLYQRNNFAISPTCTSGITSAMPHICIGEITLALQHSCSSVITRAASLTMYLRNNFSNVPHSIPALFQFSHTVLMFSHRLDRDFTNTFNKQSFVFNHPKYKAIGLNDQIYPECTTKHS